MTRLEDRLLHARHELERAGAARLAGATDAEAGSGAGPAQGVSTVWRRAARRRRARTLAIGLLVAGCLVVVLRPYDDGTPPPTIVPAGPPDPDIAPTAPPAAPAPTTTVTNSPPVAVDDTFTVDAGTTVTLDLLANDTDADGDPLRVVAVSILSGDGAVRVTAENTVSFSTSSGTAGATTFSYTAADERGATGQATVTVTARCAATTPSLASDVFVVGTGTTTELDLYANDSLHDGSFQSGSPDIGSVRRVSDGVIEYTAPPTDGTATFNYTVDNACGGVATATATVTVVDSP